MARRNTEAIFWSRVDIRGTDDCWPWLWHKMPNGYGKFHMNQMDYTAHALAWGLANNEEPPHGKREAILHSCNNKECCNPRQLRKGSWSKNALDAYQEGINPTGEKHHNSKLTKEQVLSIKADKRKHYEIASDYGVGRTCITRIKNGTRRKYEESNYVSH